MVARAGEAGSDAAAMSVATSARSGDAAHARRAKDWKGFMAWRSPGTGVIRSEWGTLTEVPGTGRATLRARRASKAAALRPFTAPDYSAGTFRSRNAAGKDRS